MWRTSTDSQLTKEPTPSEADVNIETEIWNREIYVPGVRIFATSCLRTYGWGPTATGKDGGLGTVTAAELGQDVTHMGVDGALGDEEPLGDLLVRQAPGDQLSDLVFALSEREFLLRTWRSLLRCEPDGCGDTVATADCPARFTPGS
jgi:hypothetical protein